MLKKVIIGIICFILLAVAGAGIYIYTLDWNKHKALVAQRLTQITGLKALIDGNLSVEIFPAPKITASRVKFYSANGNTPLVIINQITANLELAPLIDNKFIVRSMMLEQPSINIEISEKGEFNWKNVGKNSHNKSGNVEMTFDNVRINNATIAYENLQTKQQYNIPNISATVNAPSLQGPYKTDGKFIHNNSEIKFKGNISQNNATSLNMAIENAVTGSKLAIEGTIGEHARGTVSFDTRSLTDIVNIIFGENTLSNNYKEPTFFSFQYNYSVNMAKLDNFTTKYGKNITGSGNVLLNLKSEKGISAEFNMAKFDLNVLETIVRDYIAFSGKGGKLADTVISPYSVSFKLRSPSAFYKDVDAQNLNLGFNLNNGILDINSFGIVMPGETSFRTVGKVNLNDKLQYIFNQSVKSEDFRTFASVFGIDLTKQTAEENKKSVFKRVSSEIQLKGNLDGFEIYAPKTLVDATTLGFNIRYTNEEEKKLLKADIAASKIIFDKYIQAIPEKLKDATVKDKFIYQLKLIPWNNDILTTAQISIEDAVYNKIPMQDVVLQFSKEQDNLNIRHLSFKNIANAQLEMNAEIEKVFTEPQFKELSYNVKSNNFPVFASSLGLTDSNKELFKRKLFAAQGALAGSFNDFSLSSVQKFGDAEFSFTGLIANPDKGKPAVNGDLELKTSNFTNFVRALNLDYTPDIPVTVFSAAGKFKGNSDIFEFSDINARLGANSIQGIIQFDNTSSKPKLKAELDFDKFDASRLFNLPKKNTAAYISDTADFIALPAFNDTKIDYAPLNKLDFDIKASAKSFIYDNKSYLTTKADVKLAKGVLNVDSFETQSNTSTITGNFVLNSNNTPTIKGQYYIAGIKTPTLGGKIYRLTSGNLSASGTFDSDASSVKAFINGLNSSGNFQLTDTAMKGWDLDIIKFDIEQRKSTAGFEKFVRDSLSSSGESSFAKISGKYLIKEGKVSADKVLWQSPVVDMYMKLDLNLNEKFLDASFETIYHNASFSDVLKFVLAGQLAAPALKLDLHETTSRIEESERLANAALIQRENEKNEKIKQKTAVTQKNLEAALQTAKRVAAEAERFKPNSDDRAVNRTYDNNLRDIMSSQQKLNDLRTKLNMPLAEKALMDIEAEINSESAKLQLAPKALEDNYIIDGKYVYDSIFNKIAWLFDVASNNTAYYNELSEGYVKQIALLKNGTEPLSDEDEELLLKSIKKVSNDMEKINNLHTKMRDDYLFIVDTSNVDAMQDNNEIAKQALNTMLSYTKTLNKDIISSIESFITALKLDTRDYDDYMVKIPAQANEIDPTQPTTSSPKEKKDEPTVAENLKPEEKVTDTTENTVSISNETQDVTEPVTAQPVADVQKSTEADKKKIEEKLSKLQNIKSNLYELINNFRAEQRAKEEIKLASDVKSGGLSDFLSNIMKSQDTIAENEAIKEDAEIVVVDIIKPEEVLEVADIKTESPKALDKIRHEDTVSTVTEPAQKILLKDIQLVETTAPKVFLTNEENAIVNESINLMQKTHIALNNIIKQINAEEEKIAASRLKETEPAITLVQNKVAEPLKINIEDYTVSAEDTKTKLKLNPVIALNIGKELTSPTANNLIQTNRKSATKFKKARYGDVINSFAGKPKINQPIVAQNAIQNRKIELPETSLPVITAGSDIMDPSFKIAHTPVEPALVQTPLSGNKYVFAGSNYCTREAGGIVGKSILNNKATSTQTTHQQKYLFAANDVPSAKLSGITGKYAALAVK